MILARFRYPTTGELQVRNIGVIEGNNPVSDNDWETITNGGASKIQEWIDNQLKGRTCTVVLVGENTPGRKWLLQVQDNNWGQVKIPKVC
jgi:hypothetical protein